MGSGARSSADQRGSPPASPSRGQPRGERASRDAWDAGAEDVDPHDAGNPHRSSRRPAHGDGYRARHPAGDPGPDLRSVLHDEAVGTRYRLGAVTELPDHSGSRGNHPAPESAGPGSDLYRRSPRGIALIALPDRDPGG